MLIAIAITECSFQQFHETKRHLNIQNPYYGCLDAQIYNILKVTKGRSVYQMFGIILPVFPSGEAAVFSRMSSLPPQILCRIILVFAIITFFKKTEWRRNCFRCLSQQYFQSLCKQRSIGHSWSYSLRIQILTSGVCPGVASVALQPTVEWI